ncbi:MAG: DUF1573 domain-containing protein [Holophagaceae bacterium]|nr:DUF1573 domain-containing protein [Holophagaceae bacterium]
MRCLLNLISAIALSLNIVLCQDTNNHEIQRYNLGKVDPVADYEVIVPFKNSFPSAIRVMSVRTSCACLGAEFEPKSLELGDIGYLQVKINLTSKHGYFVEQVELITDAYGKPPLIFQFSGNVVSEVEVTPDVVFFNVLDTDKTEENKIVLEHSKKLINKAEILDPPEWLVYEMETITIPTAKVSDEYAELVKYGMAPPPKDTTRKFVQIQMNVIKDKLPLERVGTEKIVFRTEPGSTELVTATVNWQRETMYLAEPREVEIPRPSHGYQKYLVFSLKRIDSKPFEIEKIDVAMDFEGIEVSKISEIKKGLLQIELINNVPTDKLTYGGRTLGKLIIKTNAEDDSRYEVPVVVKR